MATNLFLALCLLMLGGACLHGYGTLWQRLSGGTASSWAPTAAFGLAFLVAVGGVLNLAGLAFAPALIALLFFGLVADVFWWWRDGWPRVWAGLPRRNAVTALPAGIAIVAIVAFVAATQFPPAAYNFHDDFEKYFGFVVRMLQTGTLGSGGALNALGSETFGGQAFLQGFLIAFLPIQYLNGLDALLCLFLLLVLVATAFSRGTLSTAVRLLSVLVVVAINPQYVNTASLYSGALLIAAAIVVMAQPPGVSWRTGAGRLATLGLVLAALMALKSSFLVVSLCLVAGVAALEAVDRRSVSAGLKSGLAAGAFATIFLLPWLALYVSRFLNAVGVPSGEPLPGGDDQFDLFSADALPYGATFLHYTAMVLIVLALATATIVLCLRLPAEQRRVPLGVAIAGVPGSVAVMVVLLLVAPLHGGYDDDLRYALPILIGVVPMMLSGLALMPAQFAGLQRTVLSAVPIVGGMALLVAFAPSAAHRIVQSIEDRHVLAFDWLANRPDYLAYNREALGVEATARARKIQSAIPAGAPVVVWTETPFQFDFARNPVFDVQPAGLAAPWAKVPAVDYVIWEFRGYAVRGPNEYRDSFDRPGAFERLIAVRSLNFAMMLGRAVQSGQVLYNDGTVVVFKRTRPLTDEWRLLRPSPP